MSTVVESIVNVCAILLVFAYVIYKVIKEEGESDER